MPIYEYRCEHCGHELEKMQKISDAPLTDCPECGQPALKKLISAAGFRLKGGGWYETDFKKSGDKKKNLHDGGGEKKDSASKPDSSSGSGAAKSDTAAKSAA
ncbi:FmdB family zinc ribbon protein [Allochromatium vinosum]|uniref:Regulatory protein, FmdB family n=1 Tax=Allochromatium vinosum (strain ATCC 17899 / DSM 180 / NBRC 103801 / NCIMB 10441 / D) TaxID=572477 RepID=D3RPT5_ALLVD|nr:zinc ribbon domain-containing protein [Allochromatium vinosum]ADC61667.1 regulatory protein, FmdB family [Allochromatium vinosum DSM 180]MBK1654464.1 zinc ribbon domain-containing protein [Allochromatium vinosum]